MSLDHLLDAEARQGYLVSVRKSAGRYPERDRTSGDVKSDCGDLPEGRLPRISDINPLRQGLQHPAAAVRAAYAIAVFHNRVLLADVGPHVLGDRIVHSGRDEPATCLTIQPSLSPCLRR